MWDLITDKPGAENPARHIIRSGTGKIFEGVISGDGHWKLHLPHDYNSVERAGKDGMPGKYVTKKIELALFDMEKDPYETTNVISEHPDVAARLKGGTKNTDGCSIPISLRRQHKAPSDCSVLHCLEAYRCLWRGPRE